MAPTDNNEMVIDAEIDGLPKPSWIGGFVRGVLVGGLFAVAGVIALTAMAPVSNVAPSGTPIVLPPPVAQAPVEEEAQTASPADPAPADPAPAGPAAASQAAAGAAAQPEVETSPVETPAPETPAIETSEGGIPEAASPEVQVAAPATEAPAEQASPATGQDAQIAAVPVTPDGPTVAEGGASPEAPETSQQAPAASAPSGDTPEAPIETAATETEPQAAPATDPGPTPAVVETPVAPPPTPELVLAGPALKVNARPFTANAEQPLLSIILTGASPGTVPAEALGILATIPVTFSVPANEVSAPFAGEIHAAGHEILAELPVIAAETTPDDITAVARGVNAGLAALPMAVGATGPAGAPLAADRRVLDTLLGALSTHGHVFVDLRGGIDTSAQAQADRRGVAFLRGGRIAGSNASADQIYQMIDIAARQAQRDGTAVVALAASDTSLKAMVRWALAGGAAVRLAPVSAVVARRAGG
ncbi:MAG: divergent polysaccharide deacetylase family protein [Pseudomonadota bacterium]